ncbi:protein-L-isoaspartate(D-aspartate) O-methyltransferase [Paraburkholderia rhynchosiae]|uniref:Protein-L-isoaspartate O-methyltransferase n=1 Tax=Paraburkholderia rhynchosiae TaxID=487049 RepID=A0A2N7WA62_9BURK|nr:protein-L-isoaspartate(D-aspartate) O-methyltransferase [Paraburkholderia rhynchosiae]PMS26300.1 protein-L-isoaspartate(D-aspartate) O-methyltransferase [Paraburkholderia rhynchosiae]CAB3729857.1 Protein-L-isoaspartate O-methyltransferase [Paraburkholderia rhynchosiae]
MTDFNEARERMVERQIVRRGICAPHVLAAMRRVPREEFVPDYLRDLAYEDRPLPIGNEQTISQPAIVATMIEAAELGPADVVLDVGTGSGYAAAVAAVIAAHVHSIERHAPLVDMARDILARLDVSNVTVHLGDGTTGLAEHAPYNAIIAAAGGPHIPEAWRQQLAIGGRIVMPVGRDPHYQRLIKLTRRSEDHYESCSLGDVSFVPLVGVDAWPAPDAEPRNSGSGSGGADHRRSYLMSVGDDAGRHRFFGVT